MSAGDENIFARWSRRKQAARHAEAPIRDEERRTAGTAAEENAETAVDGDAEGRNMQSTAAETAAEEPPEPLPRLEDLTAESDLSAFLRKGVPSVLKNTALRKMWGLDPAIRDYVGPAEYAWDFNQPGSMAGFGPLLDAKSSVADLVSKMGGSVRMPVPGGTAEDLKASSAPPLERQDTATSSEHDAIAAPEGPAGASMPVESVQPPDLPETAQPSVSENHTADAASAPAQETRRAESPQEPAPPRHGGALPR